MLNLLVKRCVVSSALAASCWWCPSLGATDVLSPARVLKNTATNGHSFSAIVLSAKDCPQGIMARDHIILIDTSASQVGEHREHGYAVLKSLLASLPETDRVRLFAVDVLAEALDEDFNPPQSPLVQTSLEVLQARVPLGATNLNVALRTALDAVSAERPANITYIGDGMSTADLLETTELRELVAQLNRRRIPVNSFGVGPQINLHLLGILAHQTGGLVTFDTHVDAHKTSAEKATERGRILAAALQTPVFFPTTLTVTPRSVTLLPPIALPIRSDRETVYLTRSPLFKNAEIRLSDGSGNSASLDWRLAEPMEQATISFLTEFAGRSEMDDGLSNSLAGLSLMDMAQEGFSQRASQLIDRGHQALVGGDVQLATELVLQVSEADPANIEAKSLSNVIRELKTRTVSQKDDSDKAKAPQDDLERLVPPQPDASLLNDSARQIEVKTQKLRTQVNNEIDSTRKFGGDLDTKISGLKRVLDSVKVAIDISPEIRIGLQKQLEGAIAQLSNQRESGDQRRIQAIGPNGSRSAVYRTTAAR